MPEYQVTIKSNTKGVKTRKVNLFTSCYSDAEKEAEKSLGKDEYIDSLVSMNFPKGKFNIVDTK